MNLTIKYKDNKYNVEQLCKYSNYFSSLSSFTESNNIIDFSHREKEMFYILELLKSNLKSTIIIESIEELINIMSLIEELMLYSDDFIKQIKINDPEIACYYLQYIEDSDVILQYVFPIMKNIIEELFRSHVFEIIKTYNAIKCLNDKIKNNLHRTLTKEQILDTQYMKTYYEKYGGSCPKLSIYNTFEENKQLYKHVNNNYLDFSINSFVVLNQKIVDIQNTIAKDINMLKLACKSMEWLCWNQNIILNCNSIVGDIYEFLLVLSNMYVPFTLTIYNTCDINMDKYINGLQTLKIMYHTELQKVVKYIEQDDGTIINKNYDKNTCYELCENGSIEDIIDVNEYFKFDILKLYIVAAKYGNINVLEWLQENYDKNFINKENCNEMRYNTKEYYDESYDDKKSLCIAQSSRITRFDYDNCVKILYSIPVIIATKYKQWQVLKWFYEHEHFVLSYYVFNFIARNDSIEMMEWALQVKCPYNIHNIVKSNNLESIKFILENEMIDKENLIIYQTLIGQGKWPLLDLCVDNDICVNNRACTMIASVGHWSTLEKCIEKGLVWEYDDLMDSQKTNSCLLAAKNKQWSIMKLAFSNGCPLIEVLYYHMAKSHDIELMDWAFDNGCPLSKNVFAAIVTLDNIPTIEWLFRHNCYYNSF